MAQRKQLSWTELRVGVFVLVGLFVLAAGIFYVTGGGGFLSPKYRLKTFLPEVTGLTTGAPVRLDGVDIGNVESFRISEGPAGSAPSNNRNIEVIMRLDKRYQKYVRSDSTASMKTEGLLGNTYVNITRGVTGTQIADNGEVPGVEEKAIKEVVERSVDVMTNLEALSQNVQDLIAGVRRGQGTLGKLLTDDQVYRHMNSILAKSDVMIGDIQAGKGTLGKVVSTDEMYNKLNTGLDNVNLMLADIRAQKGTIGKLLYDPTLFEQAKQAIGSTNNLVSDVRAGKGTLGKLLTDESLYDKLRETGNNFATASAKLNDNTTSVGKLFNDPRLYDNLAGLTGDMRLLVGDFRQNPKKFLHIKITIF